MRTVRAPYPILRKHRSLTMFKSIHTDIYHAFVPHFGILSRGPLIYATLELIFGKSYTKKNWNK